MTPIVVPGLGEFASRAEAQAAIEAAKNPTQPKAPPRQREVEPEPEPETVEAPEAEGSDTP